MPTPEYSRTRSLLAYGLTPEKYDEMFEAQGGTCAICHEPPTGKNLSIDHHHESGVVRALLCNNCNAGLGFFKDDKRILIAAFLYLEDWEPYYL